jgi:hypothetical protein
VSHADEVITDVNTRRVRARAHDDCFTIAWDYPGSTLLEVRILRSCEHPAEAADDGLVEGQELVYQDVTGSFRDTSLRPDRPYFYAVFARHPGGDWVRWEAYSLPCEPRSELGEFGRLIGESLKSRISAGPLALCLLLVAAAILLAPAAVRASGGGSGTQSGSTAKATAQADATVAAAKAAAEADPSITALLSGKNAAVESTSWSAAGGSSAGTTLVYRWSKAGATSVDEELPLLRTGTATPEPPYSSSMYRIRAGDVSALRVDVLAEGAQVVQVMPVDGETHYTLKEQTWAPFSWFPWFTARPWVLAPVFIALAALLMVRAWLRSRAWNRRLPSMTRHDRQFIARVGVILFLLAGFAWQFYEGWYAATGPSLDAGGSAAGSLASLPLLLIPPGIFVAGLIIELSPMPRRGSWGLLAVLAAAASAYVLAAAVTGATTNLNLSYYVLLAMFALIAIPRAFSAGKMGWSRNAAPHYG